MVSVCRGAASSMDTGQSAAVISQKLVSAPVDCCKGRDAGSLALLSL